MQAVQQFMFGPFRLDTANARVWRRSQAIALTPKAFAVLQYLVQHDGRLVTKEALLEAVWPGTAVGEAVLKVCIAEIRKALGDPARAPRCIATVHRRGYRFIAPVTAGTAPDTARQEAERLCELASQPGERTYLALGRRTLAEVALAERNRDQAEAELAQALAALAGAEAPLAAWRVYATAAQLHQQRGRRTEADHYWLQSAVVLRQLADALGDASELRRSLLTHPPVLAILRRAWRADSRSSPAGAIAQPAWI